MRFKMLLAFTAGAVMAACASTLPPERSYAISLWPDGTGATFRVDVAGRLTRDTAEEALRAAARRAGACATGPVEVHSMASVKRPAPVKDDPPEELSTVQGTVRCAPGTP